MAKPTPVTRMELDTPVANKLQLSASNIKRNVFSYPFDNSSVQDKGKSTPFNRKQWVYGFLIVSIILLSIYIYLNFDQVSQRFGGQSCAQATRKRKKDTKLTKTVLSESDAEEDFNDSIEMDELLIPSSDHKTKAKKEKNTAGSNDIYFTPI